MATVLILGGCGFVGRNLVETLLAKGAKMIRVVDKMLPELAGLSEKQKQMYKEGNVEFKQGNLANAAAIAKAFAEDHGPWDYVVNLAGETKYSQTDLVYKEAIVEAVKKCLDEAKKHKIKRWVEVSTGQVYDAGKKPSTESDKLKPWTLIAKYKLEAEELVKASGIPFTILRAAIVYGPGDILGITPRMICAATYTVTAKKMEFLWDGDLRINTVHVRDLCAAIHHVATTEACSGKIFNVADKNDTSQQKIADLLEAIFKIKTGFVGTMKSKVFTSVAMSVVADTANETHLEPWSDLCKSKGITSTPLTPYLDVELLFNNSLAVDGSAIEATGFKYSEPNVTENGLREVLTYFQDINAFPKL